MKNWRGKVNELMARGYGFYEACRLVGQRGGRRAAKTIRKRQILPFLKVPANPEAN